MKRFLALAVFALILVPTQVYASHTSKMHCHVSAPIYASELNAGATWYFEVFNATPNATYSVKIQWARDPSNGGHPSAGIETDETGYGRTTLPRYWAPDGYLPGGWPNGYDPFDPLGTFVAEPGKFSVHIYVSWSSTGKGTANCAGAVL